MKKNPWLTLIVLLIVFGALGLVMIGTSTMSLFGETAGHSISKNSILHLSLDGVIMDSRKFTKSLLKYTKSDRIKAVVVSINSPGGVVGPSQEIYDELKFVREELGKPVVAYSSGLMASGAFYAAVAADKIVVEPGTMMGSIGVIMEFINLEKLYDWAKVHRFTINTGKYKDSGAEYRPMRDDERALFQDLINDVWGQFKEAVATGRNLAPEYVNKYADGRVFTGAQGVELGFADETGTLEDAYDVAAELAGLGDNYEIFEEPKRHTGLMDLVAGMGGDDEESESRWQKSLESLGLAGASEKLLRTKLANRPLFLMPGFTE